MPYDLRSKPGNDGRGPSVPRRYFLSFCALADLEADFAIAVVGTMR